MVTRLSELRDQGYSIEVIKWLVSSYPLGVSVLDALRTVPSRSVADRKMPAYTRQSRIIERHLAFPSEHP